MLSCPIRVASRLALALVLVVLALPTFAVSAGPPPFRGEYYNSRDLSGSPVLVRDDASIDFNWGSGSPGSPVHADNFSVRWTAFVKFDAATYRFTMRIDDGARLYVDDVLILDHWVAQPPTTYTVDRSLGAGYHNIRMEYFEAGGGAVAKLSWREIGEPTYPQWKGEYYANAGLSGSPVLVRNDTDINFNWGYGSPAGAVPCDNFSVRWTRAVSFDTAGTYTFTATADDGIRVKVDGTSLIDHWVDQAPTTYTGSMYLSAGSHNVKVEYYERGGAAQVKLSWARSGPTPTTVTVDDLDSGFVRGGTLSSFYPMTFGYANHLFYVWNNTTTVYNWGKWFPKLPAAGNYEVRAFVPSRYAGTTSARYRVYHAGERADRTISQARYYDQWVSLGTYYFDAGGSEYVFLGSATGESVGTRTVCFDAVRFVGKDSPPPPVPPPPPPPGPCAIRPVLGFGEVWNNHAWVRNCLGCPTRPESSVWMAEQTYQSGTMFWRQDTATIYVLYNDGTWQQFADTWHAGEAEIDPDILAPSGLLQPKRGFGEAWRGNSPVRSRLGWATREEWGFYGSVQPFDRGLMIYSPRLGIFSLCNDGHWQRF